MFFHQDRRWDNWSRGEIVYLGRDLDLNLRPLFFFTFEDGGGVPGEVLQLVDGRIAVTTRDRGRGSGHL